MVAKIEEAMQILLWQIAISMMFPLASLHSNELRLRAVVV